VAKIRGLTKRGGVWYSQHKRDGRWVRSAVGRDLAEAVRKHERLRGGEDDSPAPLAPAAAAPRAPSLDKLAERWLAMQVVRSKPTTVRAARTHVRRLLERMRQRRADSITSEDLDAFVQSRRRDGVKDNSINNDLRILKSILRWSVAEGLLAAMPTRVRLLRCVNRRTVEIFTPKQMERVLSVAEPRVRLLLTLAATTGLRLAELVHLRWRDVDLRELRVDVTAKRYRRRRRDGVEVEESWSPKSHAERTVFITADVADELRRFRATHRRRDDTDWIFQGRRPGDRWMWPSTAIREAFQAAGIYEPGKLTHCVRHSVATLMLQQGVDLETVRSILGHADVSTTSRYLHAVDERKRAAAKVVGLLARR
jgi:site-specific recombinase XerD